MSICKSTVFICVCIYLVAENDAMVAADYGLDLSDDFDVLR